MTSLEATDGDSLSHSQLDMWLAERLGGLGAAYHLAFGLELVGELETAALERAVAELLERHPILGACFPERDGTPYRDVSRSHSRLERAGPNESPPRLTADRIAERFDPTEGPLWRASLLSAGPDRWLLLVVCHHLVFDGLSRDLFARDLAELYRAELTGCRPELPPVPPYREFLSWERARLHQADADPAVVARVAALAADPGRLSDHLPGAVGEPLPGAATIEFSPPEAHRRQLGQLAAGRSGSLFSALLATIGLTLDEHCLAGADRSPALAVPVDTRPHEFAAAVGPFVNELRWRPQALPGGATFSDQLGATAGQLRELLRLRSLPLAAVRRLAGHTGPPAAPGIIFGYRRLRPPPTQWPGLRVRYLPTLATHASRAELEIQLVDDGQRITGWLTHQRDRLSAATVGQLLAHWRELTSRLIAAPDRPLARVTGVPAATRRQLVTVVNATDRPDRTSSLADRFAAQVAAAPAAPAVVMDGHPRPVSYRELDQRADQLADQLRRLGAGPETVVAVHAHRSPELVVALVACWKTGAVYLPLDPEQPAARAARLAHESQARILLTQRGLAGPAAFGQLPVRLLDELLEVDWPTGPVAVPTHPDQAAYAIYTSGSTGTPKAAVTSHAAIDNRLQWMQRQFALTAADRVLHKTPIGFDVSIWELCWPLVTGAQLILAKPGGHRDSGYLVDLIDRTGVTTIHFVPSMLAAFLEEPLTDRCGSLRQIICSGEELPWPLAQRCRHQLPAELYNLYGPTEAAIDVSWWRCQPEPDSRVPIGHPIDNTQLYLLDQRLQPVPPGAAGELYIGGVGLARGYLSRPGLTADRFVPDPFRGAGSRLYRTGDLAYRRADGALVFLGRLDDQVKIRGQRVEPAEVAALLGTAPAVAQAVVVPHRFPQRDETALVGYVVPATGHQPPASSELLSWLRDRLPDQLVPAALVWLESLPVTANGKLDRRALPPPPAPAATAAAAPIGSATEQLVAQIWQDLFAVAEVGAADDFFALGGHSLLATRTLARLRAETGVELSMRTIFDHSTVSALAAAVDRARP